METTTIQPGRSGDAEDLAFSPLDSESRFSFESAVNEKAGDEEALIPPRQTSQEGDQPPFSGSRAKLLLWMLANTLATIGIVRPEQRLPSQDSRAFPNQTPGLHQQDPLYFVPIQTCPTNLRILPFLHDRHTSLHPLATIIRILRAQTCQDARNATPGRSHVFECDTPKLLPRLLVYPILSNLPRPPHPNGSCDQFLLVPEDAASDGRLCTSSNLRRCGDGYVL